jgi:hypothetical protein
MPPGAASIGCRLFETGWQQGSLLAASPNSTVNKRAGGAWQTETSTTDGSLVLATQTCDMVRDAAKEPTVEFLRAYWTEDKSTISEAKKNSNRLFLLRTEERAGATWGLVADATTRMLVEKASLLDERPEAGCLPDRERGFQRWLARRYDRPAVPDALDKAVHRPVVKGLREERRRNSRVSSLLEGVAEVRYAVEHDGPPFEVAIFFVPEDGTLHAPVTEAEAEEVSAWFMSTIGLSGEARVVRWEVWPLNEVSVADYFAATPLSLYEFSS